uniref:NR LBD domain-containing protein n=1 Tax=Meloidogyne javanica TaxID=6303 RepID=A0A915MBI5_MELJA
MEDNNCSAQSEHQQGQTTGSIKPLKKCMPSSDDISPNPNLHNNCTNVAIQSNLTSEGASDSRLMNTLHFLGKCHYRIWASNTPFDFASLNSSLNIHGYLEDPNHILAKADEFSDCTPSFWDSEKFRAEVEMFGFSSPKHIKILTKDHFLAMEFAKVVLSFDKLDIDDQALIIKDLIEPIFMFFNSYYASCMKADQLTTSEGLTLGTMLMTKSLINDGKIQKFRQQLVFQSVQAFADLDLAQEEFLLLLAILISSSNGLSAKSREIIYNNSVQYSKLLFKILQTKYGVNATKRFVPVMQLVAKAHKLKYISKTLGTYIEVFILRGKDAVCQNTAETSAVHVENQVYDDILRKIELIESRMKRIEKEKRYSDANRSLNVMTSGIFNFAQEKAIKVLADLINTIDRLICSEMELEDFTSNEQISVCHNRSELHEDQLTSFG